MSLVNWEVSVRQIVHIILVQNFTRDTLPKNLIFSHIHKCTKSMQLQYVVLVRDADIEMAK